MASDPRIASDRPAVSLVRGPEVVEDQVQSLDEVLRAVAGGSALAFERLYDALAAQVYGLVLRVVRDPAQSEEVAQEIFLEVWRQAPRFEVGKGSAATWVLTMAHRRAVDRVRSAQASSNREERAGARDHVASYDTVVEQVEARLERDSVRRCLDSLTQLQRESLTMAYYGGLTYREVAERLQVPLGTIKTRLRDGLVRLRDCLGLEGVTS